MTIDDEIHWGIDRDLDRDREREPPAHLRAALPRFYGDIEAHSERAPRAWPKYMTARVAADYTDTSPWTIRRNVRACGRRGRTLVYSLEDVEAWMRGTPVATSARSERDRRPTRRARARVACDPSNVAA